MLGMGNTQAVPEPAAKPPTQAQLNAYFGSAGPSPWPGMKPDGSVADPGNIPQPAAKMPPSDPDQMDRLAAVIKAKAAATPPMPEPMSPTGGEDVSRGTPGMGGLENQIDQASLDALKQQGLSVDQLKNQLQNLQNKELPLDLRPIASLVDSWTGSKLSKAATPIETAEQRQDAIMQLQNAIGKNEQGMSQDQLAMLKTKLGYLYHEDEAASRKELHDETMALRREALAGRPNREEAATAKEYTTLGKELNSGTASSRSDFGRNQATVTNAGKIEQLGDQAKTQKNGLSFNQMHELALATGALVSNGNAATDNTVKHMVPEGAGTVKARVEQWLTGDPTGTGQMGFVKQMFDTAAREKHNSQENLKAIKADIFAEHPDLIPTDRRYVAFMKHHFGDTPNFDKNGNYIRQPFNMEGGAGAMPPPPKVGEVVDGYKFIGGDPKSQKSWEAQ